ncbi:hypothetical protein [Shouchella lehensis]|uniref:Transcriptional regulator n=1 Tax=Shouchella lehensis G1 TaxID=1246626 RepID=A0A060M5R3_9BACI|nr:hypothetical protein [Shouchella lehensis]AIC95424.1 hypothetical protein BleG1_2860 [Shouchella lehensis G1]
MFGIGKKRTKIGQHLDTYGYTQEEFRKTIKINKDTATKMCREDAYIPSGMMIKKVMNFIRRDVPGAKAEDYFDI